MGEDAEKAVENKEIEEGGTFGDNFPELEDIITFPSLGDMEGDLIMSSKNNTWFSGFQGIDLGDAAFEFRRICSSSPHSYSSSTTTFNSSASVFEPKIEHLWKTVDDLKMEERRQKLSRYRKKRRERNFGRKIQYACRKALADNQPRVRGRFASK